MRMRESAAAQRAERAARRKAAQKGEAKLRAQIAALEAELEAQRVESELLTGQEQEEVKRRGSDHAELLRLRHADPDTEPADDGRSASSGR